MMVRELGAGCSVCLPLTESDDPLKEHLLYITSHFAEFIVVTRCSLGAYASAIASYFVLLSLLCRAVHWRAE
jgi:hypothetical protein